MLGLTQNEDASVAAGVQRALGSVPRRERHLRSKTCQRDRLSPSNPALRWGLTPEDPRTTLRRTWPAEKGLVQSPKAVSRRQPQDTALANSPAR
jgi:hypothetical protein